MILSFYLSNSPLIITMISLLPKIGKIAYGVKYSRFYLEDLARDKAAEQRALLEIEKQKRI